VAIIYSGLEQPWTSSICLPQTRVKLRIGGTAQTRSPKRLCRCPKGRRLRVGCVRNPEQKQEHCFLMRNPEQTFITFDSSLIASVCSSWNPEKVARVSSLIKQFRPQILNMFVWLKCQQKQLYILPAKKNLDMLVQHSWKLWNSQRRITKNSQFPIEPWNIPPLHPYTGWLAGIPIMAYDSPLNHSVPRNLQPTTIHQW
jgi:hypothetical protein